MKQGSRSESISRRTISRRSLLRKIKLADEVKFISFVFARTTILSSLRKTFRKAGLRACKRQAKPRLCRFIDEYRLLELEKDPPRRRPLVVLAFDEADVLTDNPPEQKGCNLFLGLRSASEAAHLLQNSTQLTEPRVVSNSATNLRRTMPKERMAKVPGTCARGGGLGLSILLSTSICHPSPRIRVSTVAKIAAARWDSRPRQEGDKKIKGMVDRK